jgi:hypothetical protein
MTGEWPKQTIDHRNAIKSDNRAENLREATSSQNAINRSLRSDNALRIKGVHFHKHSQRYVAQISVNGKQRTLGYFNDPELAELAYLSAADRYHGAFARGATT